LFGDRFEKTQSANSGDKKFQFGCCSALATRPVLNKIKFKIEEWLRDVFLSGHLTRK
jgi:hypothetical protein